MAHGRMGERPCARRRRGGRSWCPGVLFHGARGRCWILARGEPPRRRQAQGLSPMRPWAMASCSVLLYYYTLILYYYITFYVILMIFYFHFWEGDDGDDDGGGGRIL